ncbi:unnamed protein product [Meganyctiphanes norvegica]|uniref:SAYSvFN domain-containing protein n=1 Tax=Meganyctiphanes norvegica TaxID=48144 RepID=A0AAV2SFE9_MEGNR
MSTKDPRNNNIKEQLAAYRSRQKFVDESQVKKQKVCNFVFGLLSFGGKRTEQNETVSKDEVVQSDSTSYHKPQDQEIEQNQEGINEIRKRHHDEITSKIHSEVGVPEKAWENYTTTDWAILALKWTIWLIIFKIFLIIEFGAVYLIFSGFVIIWINMNNGTRAPGTASAYSVFNPNCETIDGTFTAEQFERELLHKMY